MQQFSDAFKARVVQRLIGPRAMSANALAEEVGVSQESLSRWLRAARSVGAMTPSQKKSWTGAEKLRVVTEASGLTGGALGAFLRREGLHEIQLTAWRAAAQAALGAPPRPRPGGSPEVQRIRELERELRRKDKALAETAALLVLKNKVQAIWGDEDDTTAPTSARRWCADGRLERAPAIMQLFELNRFQRDDDVSRLLPLPVRRPHHPDIPITFRQLIRTPATTFGTLKVSKRAPRSPWRATTETRWVERIPLHTCCRRR